jgi:hypothetical protein
MLIVEYLVGGVLVLLALGFLIVSFFPSSVQEILNDLSPYQPQSSIVLVLLSTIFVAIAYAVGVFSEFFCTCVF